MHAIRLSIVLCIGVLSGCSMLGHKQLTVKTRLEARSGSAVTGTVRMSEHDGIVRVAGSVRGLEPNSEHGFHIHEKGDCSAADASSAGGHFNPAGTAHGAYNAAVHHGGDLASLKADARGEANFDFVVTGVTLGEGPTGINGRSLVVHGKADDFTTQPSGNSGPRLACGVI
jgi:superoxide dismutase, Cu-Zn family